jgi:outer membrane protein OmpA-like peptidoglycan-associated protein
VARHQAKTPSSEENSLAGLVGLLLELQVEIEPVAPISLPQAIAPVMPEPIIIVEPEPIAIELPPEIIPIRAEVIPEESSNAYESLQQLLFGAELQQLDEAIALQISQLQQELHDPQQLAQILMPGIAEALQQRIDHSRSDIIDVLAPLIDQIINSRIENNNQSMIDVFGSIIAPTLTQGIEFDSNDMAMAISPIIGKALQRQVALEEGPVVDALYPIIGGTISKYLGETVKQINAQIEDSFSVKGLTRKFRAKLQGVSEAELILKEANPFQAQALFLIHKTSGLVIAESQPEAEEQQLESDMMAGMLTAIQSFANDCMTQTNKAADLNILDYGASKVLLEVAGSCYLAVVIRGEIEPAFVSQMRKFMADLIRYHGESIEQFEGDTEAIPSEIKTGLETLRAARIAKTGEASSPMLLYLGVGLLSTIALTWGSWQYYQHQTHQAETQAQEALLSNPEVSVYNIATKAHWQSLDLTGRVPNPRLRSQAEALVKQKLPDRKINNKIYTIQMPVAEEITRAELDRLTQLFNQQPGSQITATFQTGQVQLSGIVATAQASETILQTFTQVVGVDRLTNTLQVQKLYLEPKIYFDIGSASLSDPAYGDKLQDVISFLQKNPDKHLTIIGHSKNIYSENDAAQLALDRASLVRHDLVLKGVAVDRLQVRASTQVPPQIKAASNMLDRSVLFEVF